jgi:hypothetical protein
MKANFDELNEETAAFPHDLDMDGGYPRTLRILV